MGKNGWNGETLNALSNEKILLFIYPLLKSYRKPKTRLKCSSVDSLSSIAMNNRSNKEESKEKTVKMSKNGKII
jgi:hypothetical protein